MPGGKILTLGGQATLRDPLLNEDPTFVDRPFEINPNTVRPGLAARGQLAVTRKT
jgi:hypothetical protein